MLHEYDVRIFQLKTMYLTDEFKKQFIVYLQWLFDHHTSFILSCMNIRPDGEIMFDDKLSLMSMPMQAYKEMLDFLGRQGFETKEIMPMHYEISIVC